MPAQPSENIDYSRFTQLVEQYVSVRREGPVVNPMPYADLQKLLESKDIVSGEQSWSSVWEAVETYLEHSVKTAHPQYFNQLWAGQSDVAMLGSFIETLANTSMYTYEVAPMATLIENELLHRFKRVFGFSHGDAQVTTGGSNSNYLAFLLALHKKFPDIKHHGLQALPEVAVFVSEDAHYSMDKAMVMAGVGLNALVKVPVDANGVMQTDTLAECIIAAREAGKVPVAIIGTAGTTVRGAFDDFLGIGKLAKEHGCWFHIDGAWGGAVAFSNTEKRLLAGRDLADSMSWDGHKMLGVPLMCGMLFVREQGHFDRVCNLGDTSYIFHDGQDRQDLGPYSLQCGRRVDMLKMWLETLYYGEQGLGERVDHFMAMSHRAEQRVLSETSLELQSVRWINNICFRSRVPEGVDSNTFNKQVRDRLHASGNALVNIAYIGDDLTVRLIVTNKEVRSEDIDQFFDHWLEMATQVEQELLQCA